MSAFCIHLDDETPLFVEGYQHPHYTERRHVDVDPANINPYWYQLMEQNQLKIIRVELFYGPAELPYTMGIHTDRSYGDWGKINWIFGGEGCQMHWYKALTAATKEVKETPVHSNYHIYEPSEVKRLYSTQVVSPSIVQVGIPHNITNPGHERWCYSMVLADQLTQDQVRFGRLKKAFGI